MAISTINSPYALTVPGSVIQTASTVGISGAGTPYASTTTFAFTSTGLTVSITPKFSTSKILVTATGNCGTAASGSCYFTIYRNSTNLATGSSPCALSSLRNNTVGASPVTPLSMTFLDSPATTSATSYTVYFFPNNGNTVNFGVPNSDLTTFEVSIVVQEIAA